MPAEIPHTREDEERRASGRKPGRGGRAEGFSLIELLIVVAIILIIAAIAVPNLLSARRAANEASAVGSMRTLLSAEITFQSTYPDRGYTCSFTRLGPPAGGGLPTENAADLIDNVLATGSKSGYVFTLNLCGALPNTTFHVDAVPQAPGQSGQRAFCSDPGAVIWSDPSGVAATCFASRTPLQ